MKRNLTLLIATAGLVATTSSAAPPHDPADALALHEVEIAFHQAASTKNLDLMMSLFADEATLSIGGKSYVGKDQVRNYFATVAGPFQPQNHWYAYTPAQRIRIDVQGDKASLYFECLYMDVLDRKVGVHTFSDDRLVRSGGKWLIREMKAGPVADL